ncbi:Trafficking protein particle complex subunit 4, partial [Homalodisca vitripennis]
KLDYLGRDLKMGKYRSEIPLAIIAAFGGASACAVVGHVLTALNSIPVTGKQLDDGRDALQIIENKDNYPLRLKFGRPKMTTNEKIFLASMFYPLFAIASQLSPEPKSSGIEVLEADTFKLHCFQTLTG